MKNLRNLTRATGISIGIMAVCMMGAGAMAERAPAVRRILILLGGDFFGGGYIQALTYVAFFWAFYEVKQKLELIYRERRAFSLPLIPTNEKNVLLSGDITNLKFKLVDYEKKEKYLLTDLLKKACFKFRNAGSIGELIDIVTVQVEIYQDKAESDQSVIRYLAWVIPSVGFVGTVIGISQSLAIANSGDMQAITSALAVAFDTTLVALVLSIIIMWYVHELQEKTDKLHSDVKEFVIENFINKIELS